MTEDAVRTAWNDRDAAACYENVRPGYPEEAIDFLIEVLGIGPGARVLDLGAGTGKLTRQLVTRGADMVAVEPLEGMRATFASVLPDVPVLEGKAEAIPLPDSSVDAVVAGQAWHWFDPELAAAEAARVLHPHGGVGLLWNNYDQTVALTRELSDPVERYDQDLSTHFMEGRWQAAFTQDGGWTPLERRLFPHAETMAREEIVSRLVSTSMFAAIGAAERDTVRQEVMRLLDCHAPVGDTVTLSYQTELFWTLRR